MTTPRRPLPAVAKVVIIAALLLASGGVLSLASCFGLLSTINRSHGEGAWTVALYLGLGFLGVGTLLFAGLGLWACGLLVKALVNRLRGTGNSV
jgi:hypothetical protein